MAPSHPLDPLTPEEIRKATSLARMAVGNRGGKVHFASCEAVEATKDELAKYYGRSRDGLPSTTDPITALSQEAGHGEDGPPPPAPGPPPPRRARVIVLESIPSGTGDGDGDAEGDAGGVAEGSGGNRVFTVVHVLVFTLTSEQGRIRPDSHVRKPGKHTAVTGEEYERVEDALRRDPGFLEAMRARGVDDMDLVMVDPWCVGPDPAPGMPRMAMPLVFVRTHEGSNGYARPVDDLRIVVELDPFRVVVLRDVDARGPREPVPYDVGSQYGRSDPRDPSVSLRRDLKPFVVTQPEGPSFRVDGRRVRWQSWDIHVGFTAREGLVLGDVTYRGRPVLHRGSFSEMIVPYGDPAFPNYLKNAFDGGEDGLGRNANSLRLGCDCLGVIHYFDADVVNEDGTPRRIESAICLHEEDIGLLWKHTDWRTGRSESRRYRRLVLSFITTIANYDYAHYVYFNQVGAIEFEVKLTGILSVSTSRRRAGLAGSGGAGKKQYQSGQAGTGDADGNDDRSEDSSPYGVAVAPGIAAPIHQHFFCVRLDPNLDGDPASSVYEVECRKPTSAEGGDPHGSGFVYTERELRTEREAARRVCVETSRHWKVASSRARNRVGERASYRLVPGANCVPFVTPQSAIGRRTGFFFNHLWVTPFRPEERFPAGDFPNQRPATEPAGLAHWTARDRSIAGEDVVMWYTFGVTHVPRAEDWGIMPVERAGFKFEPCNFWDANPSIDLPDERSDASASVRVGSGGGGACCSTSGACGTGNGNNDAEAGGTGNFFGEDVVEGPGAGVVSRL